MNISCKWLSDYIQTDLTPEEISKALTSIGLETGGIEKVQTIKGGLEGMVVGKVLTCVDHPNSDHLHVTTVDLGDGQPVQIVCGAANVRAGQHVIVATLGTVLYDGDQTFTIKKSKIRGEESFGMICAEDEIGVGTSHDGIIVLDESVAPGTLAKDYYNIQDDYVLEVDITPNRVDAASHYGVARDLAAYLKQNNHSYNLKRPSVEAFKPNQTQGQVHVTVRNTEACPRYCGITIKGVKVTESPKWLQERLAAIGVRPINNIVDITNYILHETGQPLHCFDLKEIQGGEVIVETLPEGTSFITLDGVERKLSEKDLMICNKTEGMCIAGVFGGLKSGVTETTTDVFIESAYFNSVWIRKTARRHGLNTDASFRYERGADPMIAPYAAKRAALMIQELAGGQVAGDIVDVYPNPIQPSQVTLPLAQVTSLIGKEICKDTLRSILGSLEIKIEKEEEAQWYLTIPAYRVDVYRSVDVIEDILRIYGYNNIEFTNKVNSNLSPRTSTDNAFHRQNIVSEQLVGAGYVEIMNNSLTRISYYENGQTYTAENCVRLMNPLSNDLSVMRQTLLFGGLESILYNINRRQEGVRMFEFGNCYRFEPEAEVTQSTLAPYKETFCLGMWLCGKTVSGTWTHADMESDIFQLKADVENILQRLGIDQKRYRTEQIAATDLYGVSLNYYTNGGKWLLTLAQVHPSLLKTMEISLPVAYAQINWTLLMKEADKNKVAYTEISKYPAVKRDLALLLDQGILFDEIKKVVLDSDKKLIKSVSLFDVYEGKHIEQGKKSYAISLVLQDEEKTLSEKQIETLMQKVITNLQNKLEAKLR